MDKEAFKKWTTLYDEELSLTKRFLCDSENDKIIDILIEVINISRQNGNAGDIIDIVSIKSLSVESKMIISAIYGRYVSKFSDDEFLTYIGIL